MKKNLLTITLIVSSIASVLTGCGAQSGSGSSNSSAQYSSTKDTDTKNTNTQGTNVQNTDTQNTNTQDTNTQNTDTQNNTAQARKETAAYSIEDAKKAVLNRVEGAAESNLRINLETDDGLSVYDGELIYDQKEYDFEINANTGEFLEWSEEYLW